jgi:hypothetical protein
MAVLHNLTVIYIYTQNKVLEVYQSLISLQLPLIDDVSINLETES